MGGEFRFFCLLSDLCSRTRKYCTLWTQPGELRKELASCLNGKTTMLRRFILYLPLLAPAEQGSKIPNRPCSSSGQLLDVVPERETIWAFLFFCPKSAGCSGSGSIRNLGHLFVSQSSVLRATRGSRYRLCGWRLEFTGDCQLALSSILLWDRGPRQ